MVVIKQIYFFVQVVNWSFAVYLIVGEDIAICVTVFQCLSK